MYGSVLLLPSLILAVFAVVACRYRLAVCRADQARAAVPNEFQQSIVLDNIYVKNPISERGDRGDRKSVRILSWNIERGHHPDQIAQYIERVQPDIVCLQEVDWGNHRTDLVDVLDDLARRTQMIGLYGVEFLEICTPYRATNMKGGGVTGNAFLTRIRPATTFRVDLPVCLDWEFDWDHPRLPKKVWKRVRQEKRVGKRFALCAEFTFAGKSLVVSSVHLENVLGGVAGRYSQFMRVVDEIRKSYGDHTPSVIAGDFNTFDCTLARALHTHDNDLNSLGMPRYVDESRWWKEELLPKTGYADPFDPDVWTFQITPLFRKKLDWVTVKGGQVVNFAVGPFASSDHRPLWIDISLDSPTRKALGGNALDSTSSN